VIDVVGRRVDPGRSAVGDNLGERNTRSGISLGVIGSVLLVTRLATVCRPLDGERDFEIHRIVRYRPS
jgi:hypothetical protein